MSNEVFNRCEQKYVITNTQFESLLLTIQQRMQYDSYNQAGNAYHICNIYYDSEQDSLIQHSLQKPYYKEKLRLRAYGTPQKNDMVFLEIKKKCKGIVNKRRTAIPLQVAYDFINTKRCPPPVPGMNQQVIHEIQYMLTRYSLLPKLYLSYDRFAFYDPKDTSFRITFDTNIVTRRDHLQLEAGRQGEALLPQDTWIMEVKANNGVKLWFAALLSENHIYPHSFSKYGAEYTQYYLKR